MGMIDKFRSFQFNLIKFVSIGKFNVKFLFDKNLFGKQKKKSENKQFAKMIDAVRFGMILEFNNNF